MVKFEHLDPSVCMVTSENPKKEGLVIHGYGGNKEEMLGLALNLAESADLKLLVFDLPGHGSLSSEEFNLKNSLDRLNEVIALGLSSRVTNGDHLVKGIASATPLPAGRHGCNDAGLDFFIGHSVGARLGLIAGMENGILLSMPGSVFFEGRKRDLIKTLRVRRVKEKTPFSGLEEMLSVKVKPRANDLLMMADQDIQSVKALYDEWQKKGHIYQKIKGSNHLDIVSSNFVAEAAKKWLGELN